MDKVDLWESGQFSEIECPIVLPKRATEEEWNNELNRHGYTLSGFLGCCGHPPITVYAGSPTRDMDYHYMVVVDICGEGRMVFMKKWYDLTEFLTKHGMWATNDVLNTMLLRLDSMDGCGPE